MCFKGMLAAVRRRRRKTASSSEAEGAVIRRRMQELLGATKRTNGQSLLTEVPPGDHPESPASSSFP